MIIGGSRKCGKTTELIKQSSKNWMYIVCVSSLRARQISVMAKELGLNIPYPLTIAELPKKSIRINAVLIDDLEDVLSRLIGAKVVHASSSHKFINLNI